MGMVVRETVTSPQLWVGMPTECAWWVAAVRADGVFTAAEATAVGWEWLLFGRLLPRYALRDIHNPTL